jgi:hypothetical protein
MTGLHRKRKRETTTDDYAAMLARMVRAYGNRIGQDPAAGLAHLRQLETELTDAVNAGIYTANKVGGRSINYLAGDLGVSKQAVFKRVQAGKQVVQERERRQRAAQRAAQRKEQQTAESALWTAAPRELPPGSTGD